MVTGKAGQASQLFIQKDNIASLVDIAGQIGQQGLEHGDKEAGQQVFPEQVVMPPFDAVFRMGSPGC